jgi:pimeloyl-ACP methyl ester carboxylesterase
VEDAGTKFAEFDSGRIRYQEVGAGQEGTLFLHGFNGALGNWEVMWPLLNGCSRSVRIDIPGFGASDWETESYTLPDQANRIIDFLDAIGLERVTVVGKSMGGSLAAWLASAYPERVKATVLLAPSGLTDSLTYEGVRGYLYHPGIANSFATSLANLRIYKYLFPQSRLLQALTVTSSYGPAWDDAIKQIRQPVVIIWSEGDTVVPYAYAREVNRLIDNSVLITVDETVGHNIPGMKPGLVANIACARSNMDSDGDLSKTVSEVMTQR